MKPYLKSFIIFIIIPVVFSCIDDITKPEAQLSIFIHDNEGNEIITNSVSVGQSILFRSERFSDYAVVWTGDRGPLTTQTDVFGNQLYEFSHHYDDYGMDVAGSEKKAQGFNMTVDPDNPAAKIYSYTYNIPGSYTVTLVVGNYGRYKVGMQYEESTVQITVIE